MRTLLLFLITLFISTEITFSQDIPFSQSVYDARKQALFDSCVRNVNKSSSMIQAKLGLPVPQSTIDYYLNRMTRVASSILI